MQRGNNIYFFWKGMPYNEKYFWKDASMISGKSEWDDDYIKVPISEIEYCDKDKIEEIYYNQCKNAFIEFLHGWTNEKAKELEKKGLEYLMSRILNYIKSCPKWVFDACKKGKYGVLMSLSAITLPDELKMDTRKCSDGLVRTEKEYMKFLLGEDWNQLQFFSEKWPMFKFNYKSDIQYNIDPFVDMYCMASFYNDLNFEKDVYNSLLL
jgi:hypothetical protein